MLVEKKFIFISLPRCASTSFHISCLRNNFELEFAHPKMKSFHNYYLKNKEKYLSFNNEKLADELLHWHESILDLKTEFKYDFPVISIKRDKYETFISLYKHVIDELDRVGESKIVEKLKKLTINDILFFESENVATRDEATNTVFNFLYEMNFELVHGLQHLEYLQSVFNTLFRHKSYFHDNDENIIWFDINKINELEKWVSNITGKEFKMEKINSSKNFECNLELNDEFKQRFDKIYGVYDNRKRKLDKTII